MHWRRKWQPTPVFLPGESQGRGSLGGCRLWGRTESDMTEATAAAAAACLKSGFPGSSAGKESTCNAGDLSSIPGLGRSPGEGKSYLLQYSGLENSMDCIVHGVAKTRTQLSDFHFHFPMWKSRGKIELSISFLPSYYKVTESCVLSCFSRVRLCATP